MGKSSSGSTTKISKTSSGMRVVRRAKHQLSDYLMKIARWESNQKNPNKVSSWKKHQKPHKRSRHNNWNTDGLKKHVDILKAIIAKGPKVSL